MNKFTLRQLEFFVAAGQYGNLTIAAQHLHVSQPAITSAVNHLEHVLGYKLFHRIPGEGVTPTAAGKRTMAEVRRILIEVDNFLGDHAGTGDLSGVVTLACFEPLACFQLPGLLKRLSIALPNVIVNFTLGTQDRLRNGIHNGEFELALSYDSGFWEDLDKHILYHVTPSALLPANHRLAGRSSIAMAELSNDPFVLVDLPESREFQLSLMGRCGLEPNVKYYCGNIEVIRGIVANGLGVSIAVTNPVVNRSYDGSELVTVPFSDPIAKQAVVLAQSRTACLTRAAQAAMAAIRSHFTDLGYDKLG